MPADPSTFADYLNALIARYGPRGNFWPANPDLPKLPIREWQLFNEPTRHCGQENQRAHRSYLPVLRVGYRAVHAADRRAKVVLAGLHNISWTALADLYRHGAKRYFDAAAIHVYTSSVSRVLEVLRLNRGVMRRFRDRRKPIYVTEMGWTSARGKVPPNKQFGPETTLRGQARLLVTTYRALIRQRRKLGIERTYWFTWATPERGDSTFYFAGLVKVAGSAFTPKPALRAFTRVARRYEGCRKRSDARRCTRR
jgi:hypothetical protein